MTNLKIGNVYKIICSVSDDVYVGSTFSTLRNRWTAHKTAYNYWINNDKHMTRISIYPYFKKYGIDKFKIIKIKEYECVDKNHLESKEQLWISKTKCVNEINTFSIKKITSLHYRNNNVEKITLKRNIYKKTHTEEISIWGKEYYKNNTEEIKNKVNLYRNNNKEKIKERQKKYRENNKEKIAKKKAETYDCECGLTLTKTHKNRHEKSIKHQNYLKN